MIKYIFKSMRPFAILIAVLLTGCGETATTVSGTVTYNGEPVESGSISFRPVDGAGQSFATRIVDGAYTATDRVSPGMKLVVITGNKKTDPPSSSEEAYRRAEESKNAGRPWIDGMEPTDYIAEDAEGNSQEVEIKPGDQTIDFSLTGTPRQ